MSKRSILTSGIALLAFTSLLIQPVSATPDNANAIQMEPSIVQIQLTRDQDTASYVATIKNLTNDPLYIAYSAKDFGALNQTGNVSFYGKGYNPNTNPHGLQNSISFSNSGMTIPPDSSQQVTVYINNANKLAAGGHFGAALFSPTSAIATNAEKTNVPLKSSLASLIFLTTATGGTQSIKLLPLNIGDIRFSMPTNNYVVFQNSGNTQATPRGQITLFNPNGQIMATQVINTGSGLILPSDSRLFQTNLDGKVAKFSWPGVYKVELQYKDADSNNFVVYTKYFLYLSWWFILPALVIIAIVVLLAIKYLKSLIKWIIRIVKKAHLPKKKKK